MVEMPPANDVPPITQAAMASVSYPMPMFGCAAFDAGAHQHRRNAGTKAGEHVAAGNGPKHRHTGCRRRGFVAADRVIIPAKLRAVHQNISDNQDCSEKVDRIGDAQCFANTDVGKRNIGKPL